MIPSCKRLGFLVIICALVALSACSTTSLHRIHKLEGSRVYVADVTNVSGLPLGRVEAALYTSDSLSLGAALSRTQHYVSIPELLTFAGRYTIDEGGGVVCERDSADLEVHVAIEAWDASALASDGIVEAGFVAVLSNDRGRNELSRIEKRVRLSLMDARANEHVLGPARIIEGRYESLSYTLMRDIIDELFESR